ncbi:hypothetical protein A3E49_01410 [Candidatus Saccharibacteria bacterium RIFCSPHIGHO2_12_FULL_49_19]|nr:MAG: hypothetical protein A3E49_01410 [Candidatus Saccharibacteria bacterium RIFCSPHIGHO2_12_FULL_49_19]OGL37996.1 MAG: hypothetical protein A3B63_01765 [Candidatus Saccharibacteria bacterium RIFCSPLOWO2_01_FULL_49_22]
MKFLFLVWRLLRYRVAIMLLLFLLLSVTLHANLADYTAALILASLSLALSYVSATSVNDIADRKIDAINHPDSPGRPLINGQGSVNELWAVYIVVSATALLLAALINVVALFIILASLLINIAYSLWPIRLSYRTYLAPLALGVAYVGIPFALGLAVIGQTMEANDWVWISGLYLMFIGRIILKDFRDRKGDARYNKPTFLLKYGKNSTCLVSLLAILSGGVMIIVALQGLVWLQLIVAVYLALIISVLRRLQLAPQGAKEQVYIGVGAKMGNGLLITLLGVFALASSDAPVGVQVSLAIVLLLIFVANYAVIVRSPGRTTLAYKG